MNSRLVIIGGSGHGRVVADIALRTGRWEKIIFLDDEPITIFRELEMCGTSKDASKYIKDSDIFIAIGDNYVRRKFSEELEAQGATLPTLIHPNASLGYDVMVGNGSVIMSGAVINCCTHIGKGCIINTSASIDHDNDIGNYAHVSPGASLAGNVKVGNSTWIGIGSVISNNLSITHDCKLGAGTVVVKSIVEPGTYVGVPARRL